MARPQVYLLRSTMPFRYVWVSDAAGETATLIFYIMTGLYFRPHAQNPYFAVNDDDIDLQVRDGFYTFVWLHAKRNCFGTWRSGTLQPGAFACSVDALLCFACGLTLQPRHGLAPGLQQTKPAEPGVESELCLQDSFNLCLKL